MDMPWQAEAGQQSAAGVDARSRRRAAEHVGDGVAVGIDGVHVVGGLPVERGPRDLRQLSIDFGNKSAKATAQQSVQRTFQDGIRAARAAGMSVREIRKVFSAALDGSSSKGNDA